MDIEDDGTIFISAVNAESGNKAKAMIDEIIFEPEIGAIYMGKVTRIMTFGAFVEIAPGCEGLVHISKLANRRVEKVEDVVNVGDSLLVKVMEIDEKGRYNFSHKDAVSTEQ